MSAASGGSSLQHAAGGGRRRSGSGSQHIFGRAHRSSRHSSASRNMSAASGAAAFGQQAAGEHGPNSPVHLRAALTAFAAAIVATKLGLQQQQPQPYCELCDGSSKTASRAVALAGGVSHPSSMLGPSSSDWLCFRSRTRGTQAWLADSSSPKPAPKPRQQNRHPMCAARRDLHQPDSEGLRGAAAAHPHGPAHGPPADSRVRVRQHPHHRLLRHRLPAAARGHRHPR